MDYKDVALLGLLALAYMYLAPEAAEARAGQTAALESVRDAAVPAQRGRPVRIRVVARQPCPRNPVHPVIVRKDGAMWCRACDQGFFPYLADAGLGTLAGA